MAIRKIIFFIAALSNVVLPVKANPITILPDIVGQKPLPLSLKNVNPDLLKAACLQAVERNGTSTKQIQVFGVSLARTKDERVAACVISAKVMESQDGYTVGPTEVRYSGTVNIETGKVEVVRIDDGVAKQVALDALATKFIDIKPTEMTSDKITYTALVAGNKCAIELEKDTLSDLKRWLLTKLDCQHLVLH